MFGFIVFVWTNTWIFGVYVSENQNSGAEWEDSQAADCE